MANSREPRLFHPPDRQWIQLGLRFAGMLALISLLGTGCSRQARLAKSLQRADQYFGEAKYAEAIIEYRNALRLDPQGQRELAGIGNSYYAQNKFADAFPFLGRAVELNPGDKETRLKLANIFFLAGEYPETRRHAALILEQDTNNFDALKLWSSAATTPEEINEAFERLGWAEPAITDKSRLQLLRGRLYLQKSDLVSAERAFKTAQALDPASKDAHLILGDLYISQGRTNLAGQEFEIATQVAPTNSAVWFEWAEFKRQRGEIEESKKLLAEMVQRNPEYVPAQYQLAQLFASEGNFPAASEKLAAVLKRTPDHLGALALKARIALEQGQVNSTLDDLNLLAKKYPRYAQFHYLLATGYLQTREPARAMGEAEKATALATNYADATLLLAELRIRFGDAAAAVKPLEALVKSRPELARAYVLLGSAHLASAQSSQAIAAYRRLTELLPNSERAFYLLGVGLLAKKDLSGATESFEKVLNLNPRSFDALARLVDIRLASKDYPSAADRIQKQIELVPNAAPLYVALGRVNIVRNDFKQAAAAYRKAIELAPDNQAGYQMLSQVLAVSGRPKEAVDILEQALAKKPDDVATLTLAGSLYQNHTQDFSKARAAYERILTLQPDSAVVINNLAGLYLEHLNDKDKAYELASRAYKLAPDQPAIQDTLGWCAYQRGDFKRALTLLTSSANAAAKQPEINYHLGMAQAMMGRERLAGDTLRRALSLSTNFSGAGMAGQTLSVLAVRPENASEQDRPVLQNLLHADADNSSALFRVALIAGNQQKWNDERDTLEQLVKTNPNYFPAVVRLAEIYSERDDDQEKAFNLAQKAKELAPDDPQVMARIAPIAYRKGEKDWSSSLLVQTARAAAADPVAQYQLALDYYECGKIAEAKAAAAAALQLQPDFTRAEEARRFVEMLEPSLLASDAQKVFSSADAALAKFPGLMPARMARAAVEHQRGEREKEGLEFEQLLKEHPYCAPAIKQLVILRSVGSASEQDYELALRARKMFADDPEITRALARMVYGRKDYRQAASLLQESSRKLEDTGDSLYYLALCRYHLGDKASAKKTLQRAITLDPKIADEAEVPQVLQELE